jgi:hypothetical protein
MTLPSAKEIAKLAAACRKAGITTFKGGGIEFTLSEKAPETKAAKKAELTGESNPAAPKSEELSYEQLLGWSITGLEEAEEKADQ